MRKTNREVTDFGEIADILRRCDTIRIGLRDDSFSYIVPMSFGMDSSEIEGTITVYFHGANIGLKHSLIERDPHACVEADLCRGYVPTERSITTDYESFIGFGICEKVAGAAAELAMKRILAHCGYSNFKYDRRLLEYMSVYKIEMKNFTGKRRFPLNIQQ